MGNVIRLVLTVVFGLVWMWVYTFAGPASVLVVLGSILTLCVCCCRGGGDDPSSEWNFDRYFACLRRCRIALLVLIVALILIGLLWPVLTGSPVPSGPALVQILVAAVGSVLAIRLICCLYDN